MTETTAQSPVLGVAAIILNGHKILLGKRLTQPMQGHWQLPGGWLHAGESPVQAINRKIQQFNGIRCNKAHFVFYTDNQFASGLHSVSLYFEVNCLNPDSLKLDVNKDCAEWFWADWSDLPDPLFYPLQLLVQSSYQPNFSGS